MEKVSKVTNQIEFDLMHNRVLACSVAIMNPVTSAAKKAEYLIAYDDMCRMLQRFLRKRRIQMFPDLRRIYGILEFEFDEPDDEPIEESTLPAVETNYSRFLDD